SKRQCRTPLSIAVGNRGKSKLIAHRLVYRRRQSPQLPHLLSRLAATIQIEFLRSSIGNARIARYAFGKHPHLPATPIGPRCWAGAESTDIPTPRRGMAVLLPAEEQSA